MTDSKNRDISNYQEEYGKHFFEDIMVEYRRKCVLEQMEKYLIEKAIQKHSGNISKAAKDLGLTRAALYRRMEKYEI